MSMTIGGVGGSVPVASSQSTSGANDVQAQFAVDVQKKAENLDADETMQLIASATGIGQHLDVRG